MWIKTGPRTKRKEECHATQPKFPRQVSCSGQNLSINDGEYKETQLKELKRVWQIFLSDISFVSHFFIPPFISWNIYNVIGYILSLILFFESSCSYFFYWLFHLTPFHRAFVRYLCYNVRMCIGVKKTFIY